MLTLVVIVVVLGGISAVLPMYLPAGEQMALSEENEVIVNHILQEHGDDLELRLISHVKFTHLDVVSSDENVFYFRSDTFFGIPWSKARVVYRDGRIASGEAIAASEQFE